MSKHTGKFGICRNGKDVVISYTDWDSAEDDADYYFSRKDARLIARQLLEVSE